LLGFGVRTTFENRKGLSDMQQKKWDQQATMRKTQNNIDQDRTTLAYLGEKARNEMPLKWVVTAKWATEIIVRIADDCTTGEAQMRLQEVYDVDMDNNENMETHFIPINKRNPVLVDGNEMRFHIFVVVHVDIVDFLQSHCTYSR
jgi:hypothetical protein